MLPSKWLFLPVWVVYLLALVAFEVVADVLAKHFALNGKLVFGVLSLGGYVLANIAWLISLHSGGTLSRGSVIFSALNGVVAVVLGLCVFHERASPYQLTGMALGIAAMVFLSLE
jgi:multidrug transporter EmrE-like cation transporter